VNFVLNLVYYRYEDFYLIFVHCVTVGVFW